MLEFNILPPSEMSQTLRDKVITKNHYEHDHHKRMMATITPIQYRSLNDLYNYNDDQKLITADTALRAQPLPPITNRGVSRGTLQARQRVQDSEYDALETVQVFAKGNGNHSLVRIPSPDKKSSSNYSFIDYVNFTVKARHFLGNGISDHDIVTFLSPFLNTIFGFGVTDKRKNGMNFYRESYDLGINGWGTVCIGGQNDSVLVTVKGQGLLASKSGWEKRLYDFLNKYELSKITRIDLAHDNFESQKTLDDYLDMYQAEMFKQRGQNPNVEQAGNWINPTGKGRTLYVGTRSSGKLLRIYEKGLQLAGGFTDMFPNWVRTELEFSAKQRILPYEMLLNPGQYLAGSYPALKNLCKVQEVIETAKKTVQSTVEKALEVTRHQFGKYIWTFVELFGVDAAIEKLTAQKEQIPQKLAFETYQQFDADLNLLPT